MYLAQEFIQGVILHSSRFALSPYKSVILQKPWTSPAFMKQRWRQTDKKCVKFSAAKELDRWAQSFLCGPPFPSTAGNLHETEVTCETKKVPNARKQGLEEAEAGALGPLVLLNNSSQSMDIQAWASLLLHQASNTSSAPNGARDTSNVVLLQLCCKPHRWEPELSRVLRTVGDFCWIASPWERVSWSTGSFLSKMLCI